MPKFCNKMPKFTTPWQRYGLGHLAVDRRFATVGCMDESVMSNTFCLSMTACTYSRLSPDRPVHWQMLSNQHIRCLPRFLTPSTRPTITLPSTLICHVAASSCVQYRFRSKPGSTDRTGTSKPGVQTLVLTVSLTPTQIRYFSNHNSDPMC